MNEMYFPNLTVDRPGMTVTFYRLHRDTRDIMCDSPKPEWTAVDDFMIELHKMKTITYWDRPRFAPADAEPILRTKIRRVDEYKIRTKSRNAANRVWFLAEKAGLSYDQLVAMDKANRFEK